MPELIPAELRDQLLAHYRAKRIGDFLAVVRQIVAFLRDNGESLDDILGFLRKIMNLFGSSEPQAQSVVLDAAWVEDAFATEGTEGDVSAQSFGDGRIIEIIKRLLILFERFSPRGK